jgi:hypothetical protein
MRFSPFAILSVLLFVGCAKHPAPEILGATHIGTVAVPDSLRAKIRFTFPSKEGSEDELSAVLFAVPGKRYRLEFTGPLGIQVASMLWKPEGWLALVHPEERYVRGVGDTLQIPGVRMPAIPIHRLLAFSWGEVVPPGGDSAFTVSDSGRIFREWTTPEGTPVQSVADSATGRLLALNILGGNTGENIWLEYSGETVRIIQAGRWILGMEVQSRKPGATWGQGVWKLVIPQGWKGN